MLKPRESDVPALFFVLVVLPLVTYILLGKWSEASKRKERLGLLSQLAAEESLRQEPMAAAVAIPPPPPHLVSPPKPLVSPPKPLVCPPKPLVSPPKVTLFECARCYAPATTRCSRCKLARYCSGKCQIIHWRILHKDECQPLETSNSFKHSTLEEPGSYNALFSENCNRKNSLDSPAKKPAQNYEGPDASLPAIYAETAKCALTMMASSNRKKSLDGPPTKPAQESAFSDANFPAIYAETAKYASAMASSKVPKLRRKSSEKRVPCKTSGGFERVEMSAPCSSDGVSVGEASSMKMRNKLKSNYTNNLGSDVPSCQKVTNNKPSQAQSTTKGKPNAEPNAAAGQELQSIYLYSDTTHQVGNVPQRQFSLNVIPNGVSNGTKNAHQPMAKSLRQQIQNVEKKKGHVYEDSVGSEEGAYCAEAGNNGSANLGCMKNASHKKSAKTLRKETLVSSDDRKKVEVLFPYEEFVKLFQCDIPHLTPRGLSNCGNSCYANAVLQCLTCTKPLVVYLLKQTHSRSSNLGCGKSWCLMCELEQHVHMLRQSGGGPLSPSRILSQMRRNLNSPMGNGSQEDAHEFLRLLVASMQSICLEEGGGEKRVHPLSQETTFIQHTFGGRLRSRVKCLNCRHKSERCENFMDLTLEIFGWVESLEDALTQFTSPEDLDGENMYKCGRCGSYVEARKQLSIDVAPNILTIVLKRFQKGSYGKINKCITFAEMLDMIPYMTGKYDVPPLYSLYGVVVHMDSFNASFTGHYVAYVKDLQGNWLRIDDSDVRLVPLSQVISEGAYILFYMRSYPRHSNGIFHQNQSLVTKVNKSSSKSKAGGVVLDPSSSVVYNNSQASSSDILRNTINNHKRSSTPSPRTATFAGKPHQAREFDASSSSDWSLFTTSSDEAASFTTDSTRNSFSTTGDFDPVSAFLNSLYDLDTTNANTSSTRTVSCRMFSGSKPLTRFAAAHEEVVKNSYVVDSFSSNASVMSMSTTTVASSSEGWANQRCVQMNDALVGDDDGFDAYGSGGKCSMYDYDHSRTNHKY